MEMKKYKLSEICELNNATLKSSDNFDEILYLDTSNITKNCIAELQPFFIKNAPSRAQRKVKDKTIIFSTVRPNQKHFGILNNPPKNLIISTGFTTLDVKKTNDFDANYVYLKLTQPYIVNHLHTLAQNSVSSYPSINPDDIGNLRFDFPSLPTQQKIAAVLSSLDDKIALNKKINAKLEAMTKRLYDYWFVQFDYPDKNGKPYKTSGGKMVWNEVLKREIPEGWEVKSINDISVSYRGVGYTADDEKSAEDNDVVLILRGNNISNNHIIYDGNTVYLNKSFVSEEQKIHKYDFVMTMSSGSKEHVGKSAMFLFDSPHSYGAFCNKITPARDCPFFLENYLHSEYFKKYIQITCSGTGINNLTNEHFDKAFFPFPDNEVLESFNQKINPIYEQIGVLEKENLRLMELRDKLLPLLMNGQVEVK